MTSALPHIQEKLNEARSIRGNDLEGALAIVEECLPLVEELNEDESKRPLRLMAVHIQAHCLYFSGRLKRAHTVANEFLKQSDDFTYALDYAGILNIRGLVRTRLRDYSGAIDDFTRALSLLDRESFKEGVIQLRMNIAHVYEDAEFYDLALREYTICLDELRALPEYSHSREALFLYNMVNCESGLNGPTTKVVRQLEEVLRITESDDEYNIRDMALGNLISAYTSQSEFAKALDLIHTSEIPGETQPLRYTDAFYLESLATFYLYPHNPYQNEQLGLKYLDEAASFFEADGASSKLASCLQTKAEVMEGRGEYHKALDIYKQLAPIWKQPQSQLSNEERELYQSIVKEEQVNLRIGREMQQRFRAENQLDALRTQIQRKNEYLKLIGHDLRDNLGGVQGLSELIANELNTNSVLDRDELAQLVTGIQQATQSGFQVLQSILDLDAVNEDRVFHDFLLVDVGEQLKRITGQQATSASLKDIKLETDFTGTIETITSPKALERIVNNLLSNAIKYSYHHSAVRVATSVSGLSIRIDIIDNGPGVDPSESNRLFQKYEVLSTQTTAGEPSVGLGLFLAKRIASQINGKLDYRPNPAGGSIFTLEIPLRQA